MTTQTVQRMKGQPKILTHLLAVTTVLSSGMLSLSAEEASEHLMTTGSGTQISGYVSTSASWIGQPVFSLWHILPPAAPFSGSTAGPSPLIQQFVYIEVNRQQPPPSFPPLPPPPYDPLVPSVHEVTPRVHWAPGSAGVELAAVPEPATMTLLGVGAAALFACGRRKKTG
ncbi:MAG: hypothetical protein K0Q55_1224 [Verrucomicrobia bacterium]|nr:hypothetical protein [Verrucomicrobiota bacterium]